MRNLFKKFIKLFKRNKIKIVPSIIEFPAPLDKLICDNVQKGIAIFIGAGIAKQMGYKDWKDLVNHMVDEYSAYMNIIYLDGPFNEDIIKQLKFDSDKIKSLEYLYNLNSDLFYKIIENVFENDLSISDNTILKLLKPLQERSRVIYIQTNLDNELQNHFSLKDKDVNINPNFNVQDALINYIHGRIDLRESWVFTQRQYHENYRGKSLNKFLLEIFKTNTVFFLGYSFNDKEIQQILSKAIESSNRCHFLLCPYESKKDADISIYEKNYHIDYNVFFIKFNIDEYGFTLYKENLRILIDKIVNIPYS